jgi:3-oxocholest-4-en-26-oate---CoA ligase
VTSTSLHYATVWEAFADHIPDAPALRHGALVRSWAEFEARSARLAGTLHEHDIGRGDSVACYLYNCAEYFELFFGPLKLRAVPCNINYRYGSNELLALLENSEAKVLFFDAALRDKVAAVADRATGVRLLVEVGGDSESPVPGAYAYEELISGATPAPRIARDDDDMFLSYTGGTTGLPKGVLMGIGRSAGNCLWFRDLFLGLDEPLSAIEFAVRHAADGTQMRAIPASPLMHSTGFIFAALPTLFAGGTVTTLEHRSFDAHELLAAVETTAAQVVAIVGDAFALPMVRALDAGRPGGGRYETGSLRAICSAGVAWSAHIKERLFEHIPDVVLLDACGTTEGVTYGIRQFRRGDSLSTANFNAAPGVKVLSPEGQEMAPGEVGMLASPTVATGYFRDPEKTATTFFMDEGMQYAMPGDLGRIEPDGTLTLVGRGVTTINTGGEKVYPGEVEEVIKAIAAVDDCLVVGIPDERFGQSVAALVAAKPGHTLATSAVDAAVRDALAGYKVPRRIRIVEEIPRLPNGKVDYPTASTMAQSEND